MGLPRILSDARNDSYRPLRVALPVLLLVLWFTGCSFTPAVQTPAPVNALPEYFSLADTTEAYQPLAWWEGFNDPVLNRLIDSTLTSNLDLVEAVARVDEVRAAYRIERSALFPSVQASVDGSNQDQSANSGFFSALSGGGDNENPQQPAPPRRISFSSYSASLGLSYELDFWGRVRNSTRAALSDYLAGEADLEAARLAVLSQTITTYFENVDLRRRVALASETVDLLTERVAQTEDRYNRGLITSFELYATLQDFRNTQAGLPQLERQRIDAEGRLAVLVGRYTGQLEPLLGDTLAPTVNIAPVPVGLPADLLAQRPDVRAAAQRLESARYRIGARKAEQYPTFSLSGTLGLQGNTLESLTDLDQWYTTLAGGLAAPLFQGGRLKANVDAAEARYIQQAAAYTRTVLTAYQEAESALAAFNKERERYAFLEDQRAESLSAVDLQASRFERGVGTYLDYLDAYRTLLNVENNLSAAHRDLALARLGIHRALGGGWTDETLMPSLHMIPAAVPGTAE